MSPWQILKKSVLILSAVIVLFAVAETCLWLFNRKEYKLFVESANGEFYEINTNFIARFTSSQNIGYFASKKFSRIKEKNAFRIFVVGETFNPEMPTNPNSSFVHILNAKLQRAFSETNIEMINIPYDFTSSFEMILTVDQIVNYEPDLVILAPGRNEFYGKSTYACNNFTGSERIDRFIQNTHIYRIYRKYFPSPKTIFEIETNGQLFKNTVERFEKRLYGMVSNLKNKNIPVILINAPSNLKDTAPQKSHFAPQFAVPHQQLFETGKNAYTNGNYNLAFSSFSKIYQKETTHAETLYFLGKLALKDNKTKEAAEFFRLASDFDLIKSRVPTAINRAIFGIATVHNCYFIDLEKLLSQTAMEGLAGNNVFSGETQLNLRGNALLASACTQKILQEQILQNNPNSFSIPVSTGDFIPFDTVYDGLIAEKYNQQSTQFLKLQFLTTFEEETASIFAHRKKTWEESMNSLYEFYIKNKNYKMAFKVIENLVLENPHNTRLNDKASQTAAIIGDSQLVVHYASRVYKVKPEKNIAERIFISYLKLDKPEKALPFIKCAMNHEPGSKEYNFIHDTTNQISDLKKKLSLSPSNLRIREQIADLYFSIGNEEVAMVYATPNSAPIKY